MCAAILCGLWAYCRICLSPLFFSAVCDNRSFHCGLGDEKLWPSRTTFHNNTNQVDNEAQSEGIVAEVTKIFENLVEDLHGLQSCVHFLWSMYTLCAKDTPQSIVQVEENRYARLMDTGNCSWWVQWVWIHIDTDTLGQWAPWGWGEVTGCFDSQAPLNGRLSTGSQRGFCDEQVTGRRRVCPRCTTVMCLCWAHACVWIQTDQFHAQGTGFRSIQGY